MFQKADLSLARIFKGYSTVVRVEIGAAGYKAFKVGSNGIRGARN